MPVTLDLNSVAQAALAGQEGQIMLTGEDGHVYPVTVSGMISVPMPSNMYVSRILFLHVFEIHSPYLRHTFYFKVSNCGGQYFLNPSTTWVRWDVTGNPCHSTICAYLLIHFFSYVHMFCYFLYFISHLSSDATTTSSTSSSPQTKYVVESPISVQSPLRKGRLIPVNSAINVSIIIYVDF